MKRIRLTKEKLFENMFKDLKTRALLALGACLPVLQPLVLFGEVGLPESTIRSQQQNVSTQTHPGLVAF